MELSQERRGLFLPALCQKPTGRLGDEPDKANDEDAGEALADERDTPLVVVANIVGSVGDGCGGDTASKPAAVIETCKVSGYYESNGERRENLPTARPRQCGGAISTA